MEDNVKGCIGVASILSFPWKFPNFLPQHLSKRIYYSPHLFRLCHNLSHLTARSRLCLSGNILQHSIPSVSLCAIRLEEEVGWKLTIRSFLHHGKAARTNPLTCLPNSSPPRLLLSLLSLLSTPWIRCHLCTWLNFHKGNQRRIGVIGWQCKSKKDKKKKKNV